VIEEMRYVNILGRVDDYDRVADRYISRYDIQMERTSKEQLDENELVSFAGANPYAAYMPKIERIGQIYGLNSDPYAPEAVGMSPQEALDEVESVFEFIDSMDDDLKTMENQKAGLEDVIKAYAPFAALDFDMETIEDFKLLRYFFGKTPINNFIQYETFIYQNESVLFVEGERSKDAVWGLYITPAGFRAKTEEVLRSYHTETVALPREFGGERLTGSPARIIARLTKAEAALDARIKTEKEIFKIPPAKISIISAACAQARRMYMLYESRAYAAKTEKSFFVLTGWMREPDAKKLDSESEVDENVIVIKGDEGLKNEGRPPTKLRNPPVIRFFEFFVNMYGAPTYGEFDPTPFIAVTYTLMFGIMFGDLGQGAVVALLGLLLYKWKKMPLGAVMSVIGVSSMVFGTLYGSLFGFEDIIPVLWRRPADDLNSTLIMAVGMGVVLILAGMAVNIYNAAKAKDWPKLLFSPSGLGGFLFYGGVAGAAFGVITGRLGLAGWMIGILVVFALLIALREPLGVLMTREGKIAPDGPVVFVMQIVFEFFEVCLSYISNTISFIRVGAFALSHAMMMGVVLTLSATASGSHNIIIVIIGNALVMAMEGLVVGIQSLRLNFYELFSRFYDGDGRAFEPYKKSLGGK